MFIIQIFVVFIPMQGPMFLGRVSLAPRRQNTTGRCRGFLGRDRGAQQGMGQATNLTSYLGKHPYARDSLAATIEGNRGIGFVQPFHQPAGNEPFNSELGIPIQFDAHDDHRMLEHLFVGHAGHNMVRKS